MDLIMFLLLHFISFIVMKFHLVHLLAIPLVHLLPFFDEYNYTINYKICH